VRALKGDFPIFQRCPDLVYLDNAATTQKPKTVIDAIRTFYERSNANIHRGIYPLARKATEIYEEAHEKVAKFIGGKPQEIIFTRNTTESLNIAAQILAQGLNKEDHIVVCLASHHSNMLPWMKVARERKCAIDLVGIKEDGTTNMDKLRAVIEENAPRIVAIHAVSNVSGEVIDVQKVAKWVHDAGGLLVVDGAQSVPHMPTDVRKLGADILAFSGHKMLGPMGIGVLWMREDLASQANPILEGGDMIRAVHYRNGKITIEYNVLPWRFEAGTPNVAGAVGLMAAIEYLERIGMQNIEKRERTLVKKIIAGLESLDVSYVGPRDVKKRGGLVAFYVKDVPAHTIAAYLGTHNVCVRSGFHCAQPLHEALNIRGTVRASVYIYNDEDDVEKFLSHLEEVI